MFSIFYGFGKDPQEMGVCLKKVVDDYHSINRALGNKEPIHSGACFSNYPSYYIPNTDLYYAYEVTKKSLPSIRKLTTETVNIKVELLEELYYDYTIVKDEYASSFKLYKPCGAEEASKWLVFLKISVNDAYNDTAKYLLPRLIAGFYRLFDMEESYAALVKKADFSTRPVSKVLLEISNERIWGHSFSDVRVKEDIIEKLDNVELVNKALENRSKQFPVNEWFSSTSAISIIDNYKDN